MTERSSTVRLLTDEDLVKFVGRDKHVTNLPPTADWFAKTSPVQPTSLDLHIGEIFVPERAFPSWLKWLTEKSRSTSIASARSGYTLKSGYTAIVTTAEDLNIPSNVAAISFAPNHIAMSGLLMTNAGHVDPGYKGKLRYTLINMGRDDFELSTGQDLVTLLFFELSHNPKADYSLRGGQAGGSPQRGQVNKLSKDFIDLEKQISRVSKRAANSAVARASVSATIISVVVTLLGMIATIVGTVLLDRSSHLRDTERQVLELKGEVKRLDEKITNRMESNQSTKPERAQPNTGTSRREKKGETSK